MNKNDNNSNQQDIFKLTLEQLDTLIELGNIGSGNAVTALSKLLNNEVEVSLTSAEIFPFWKVPELFDTSFIEVFGLYSEISFNLELSIIQIFTKESLINLINLLNLSDNLKSQQIKRAKDLDDLSISIINEIGNILNGHYISALADLLSITLIPNVPIVALDTLSAMLNEIIAKYSHLADCLVIITTNMILPKIKLKGVMCLIPSINILKKLFKILNIKYSMNL